jgi:hypothetical protein
MLYLYKDIGIYWENTLSRDDQKARCSMNSIKGLKTFFHRKSNKIIFNMTNSDEINEEQTVANKFSYTDTRSSKVRSLIHHLRNSIMHGLYQIQKQGTKTWITFEDFNKNANMTTLKGKVELSLLKELINIIKNYSPSNQANQ